MDINKSSNRSFGILFSIVFSIVGLYPIFNSQHANFWFLTASFVFLFLAFFAPKVLSSLNNLWFKFGLFLGSIVSPIVLALIYFVTILPIGVIMRLLDKDLLRQRKDKKAKSYWIESDKTLGSMKDQF